MVCNCDYVIGACNLDCYLPVVYPDAMCSPGKCFQQCSEVSMAADLGCEDPQYIQKSALNMPVTLSLVHYWFFLRLIC